MHKATLTRELQRNVGKRGQHAGNYLLGLAQIKTEAMHKQKNKSTKLTDKLKEQSVDWLRNEQLSPELIAVG